MPSRRRSSSTGRTLPDGRRRRRRSCCRRTRPRLGSDRARPERRGRPRFDVAFPVLHGRFGEDGTIQGLFEMAGVPYVGAGVFASAAAMDKEYAKKLLAAAGLTGRRRTSSSAARDPVPALEIEHLGLPVFVKPARAGSSVGITKVPQSGTSCRPRSNWPAEHDDKVLIEAAVAGREIEVGVLEGDDGRARGERAGRDPAGAAATTGTTSRRSTSTTPASSTSRPTSTPATTSSLCRTPPPGVRRARRRGPGPGRLLPAPRRLDRRQRGQHDARLHPDLDVPADVGRVRRRLPDAGRPARPDRAATAPQPRRPELRAIRAGRRRAVRRCCRRRRAAPVPSAATWQTAGSAVAIDVDRVASGGWL